MRKPTQRERDCIAAIGMSAAIGIFIQDQAPPEDRLALKPLCDLLERETQNGFQLWPLSFSDRVMKDLEKKFDAVKEQFLSEPQKMQVLIDYALSLIDPHIQRLRDGDQRKEALNDIIGMLYSIRSYFDADCEDINPVSSRAAVAWAVA